MHRMFFDDDRPEWRAEAIRRETGAWLTWAMRSGVELPRIPLRRVQDGGFSGLMRTSGGRTWAASWWSRTLSSLDLDV